MPRQLLWISIGVVMSSMGVLETNSAHSTVVRTPEFMSSRRLEESGLDRDLEDIPDDVSICDEYFFGRATSLPSDQIPFCVNNGICQASWVNDPRQPCQCLDAYAGPHCEFAADQVPNVCHLGCRNGGTCALGASSWQHYHRNDGGWTDPFDLQHCECTKGYTGLICEQQGTPCGDDRCHNGGTCVLTSDSDGSNKYSCDCTTAKNSDGVSVFAGQYCEHEATSVCSDQNANQFCVNGGTCRSDS